MAGMEGARIREPDRGGSSMSLSDDVALQTTHKHANSQVSRV